MYSFIHFSSRITPIVCTKAEVVGKKLKAKEEKENKITKFGDKE